MEGKKADATKKVKNVCATQRKTLRDRNTTRVRHRRVPLVQRVSQSLPSSMSHPEPHQTGTKEKTTEIQKA